MKTLAFSNITKKVLRSSAETPSIESFLADIRQYEPLTREEEIELVTKMQKGDDKAREMLVLHNQRFVLKIAMHYQTLIPDLPLGDLIQEGNIGFLRALSLYQPETGNRLMSYAVWWIRESIQRAVAFVQHAVHVPTDQIYAWRKTRRNIDAWHHRFENLEALGSLDEEFTEINQLMADYQSHVTPQAVGYGISGEFLPSSDHIDEDNQEMLIQEGSDEEDEAFGFLINILMKKLPPKEAIIIKAIFGLNQEQQPHSTEVIADEQNISTFTVRQRKNMAIERLRLFLGAHPEFEKECKELLN